LVQRWEGRFFYPTVMPCWLNNPRAICEYTRFIRFVKPSPKIIFGRAVGIGGLLKKAIKPRHFLEKTQTHFYLLFNFREGLLGQKAEGRMSTQSLLESSDLVAFCPAIEVQVGLALVYGNAHAEFSALDGGQTNYADVQGEPIDGVNGDHYSRARLV
jgi:hypothetical protein